MNNYKREYIFFLIIFFSILSGINAQLITPDITTKDKIKRISIASEPNYPPYCIIDKNGKADGFSVDLFKAAAKTVDIEVDIKIGIWDQIKQNLAEGKIDALPLVGRTPERELLYDFTLPYLTLHGAIFVREGTTDIKTVEDLKDKDIIVMKGDNSEEFVCRKNISKNIFTTHTFEEAFRILADGEHDAVITQRVMGLHLLQDLDIESVVPLEIQLDGFRQDFCFAVKKGNKDLLSRLNEGLSIVIANGTYDRIHLKWFGPSILKQFALKDVVRIALYIFIPLIILFSIVSILFLRSEVKRRTYKLREEIFEHKKTANSLREQQILLKEMEKVSQIGGWEYNVETKQITWTDGVYNIYGVSEAEFDPSGKDQDIIFYHPEDQKILNAAFQRTLENGEPYDLELRFKSADGISKWVRTAAKAEFNGEKVVRLFGNIMDITKQKQTEEELRKLTDELEIKVTERTKELDEKIHKLDKSQKAMLYMVEDLNTVTSELKEERQKLEASNKELEAFSYSVSHDLRAPLRGIDGFSNILLEDYSDKLDQEGQRLLNVIRSNTQKMGHLIDDLLALSRIGRRELDKSEIDMKTLVNSIYHEVTSKQEREKIFLSISDLPRAKGDATMIRQLWTNLISNAVKFSSKKEKPVIGINSKVENGKNVYCIRDNGVGFDMKYYDKLFGVFQRLHSETEYKGTGVGMAIAKRIVTRHGGDIRAESELNVGTTFYFSL
ncbi:MAG: transporter substrate-binding domain-containing protein [Ignavibacteriaceae bacterium]|nr:transporter substrate-binding domain-containing protein [Ignavibacteriaceae bacterium]